MGGRTREARRIAPPSNSTGIYEIYIYSRKLFKRASSSRSGERRCDYEIRCDREKMGGALILKEFYNRPNERKFDAKGRKNTHQIYQEYAEKVLRKQESFANQYTKYTIHVRQLPRYGDGLVKYTTKYGRIAGGYSGRLFAKNTSPQQAPRRIREFAYQGLGVRDWDVQSAYFAFAYQDVAKLRPKLQDPAFQLSTVKRYLEDRKSAWASVAWGKSGIIPTPSASIYAPSYSTDRQYRRNFWRTHWSPVYLERGELRDGSRRAYYLKSTSVFAATQGRNGRRRVCSLFSSPTSSRGFCTLSTTTVKTTDAAKGV